MKRVNAKELAKELDARQRRRKAKEGEICINGVHLEYVRFDKNALLRQSVPFEVKKLTRAEDKAEFCASHETETSIEAMTLVPGQCETFENGWRIKAAVTYKPEAKTHILEHNLTDYLNSNSTTKDEGDTSPSVADVIDHKWLVVRPKDRFIMKVPYSDKNVMLERKPDGVSYVVGSHTPLTYFKCKFGVYVNFKNGTITENVSISSNGVELSATFDVTESETERYHRMENKDEHHYVPIADFRTGAVTSLQSNVYTYVRDGYEGPGVSLVVNEYDEMTRFLDTFNNTPTPRTSYSILVVQHKPGGVDQTFKVLLTSSKKTPNIWRSFGYGDMRVYAAINFANQDLYVHTDANMPSIKSLLEDPNNASEVLTEKGVDGFYTLYLNKVTPDYPRYLPERAIRLSRKRVEHEFRHWLGVTGGETSLELKMPQGMEPSPLHSSDIDSPVICLGNGQVAGDPNAKGAKRGLNHGISANVWPILDTSDFYVLMSKTPTEEERKEPDGDVVLDRYLASADKEFKYMIFAVRKDEHKAQAADKRVKTDEDQQ